MSGATTGNVSQRTQVYAEREMLKYAGPKMVLDKFGMTKLVPKNKSVNVKFRRPVMFDAATIPLTEGVTPPVRGIHFEDVSATLRQYGDVRSVTDVMEDTHEDPVLQTMVELSGKNVGKTQEALNWAVLQGGTNVFYGNGTSRGDVNTAISLSKQRAVTRALKAQKAEKITKMLSASPGYETRAIEAAYIGVAHTHLESDIRNLSRFTPVAEYGQRRPICEDEIGSVEDVRYILSPDLDPILGVGSGTLNGMVSSGGSNVDIYPVLYFGEEAYGVVGIKGTGAIEPSVIPTNMKTKDDPLGQLGYVGWKMWHVCVILNNLWMARLEVGVTDL